MQSASLLVMQFPEMANMFIITKRRDRIYPSPTPPLSSYSSTFFGVRGKKKNSRFKVNIALKYIKSADTSQSNSLTKVAAACVAKHIGLRGRSVGKKISRIRGGNDVSRVTLRN